MSELIQLLIRQADLNEEQARQVVGVLKANADRLPGWIFECIAPRLPSGGRHGGLLGD
jgi:hypothetical protein